MFVIAIERRYKYTTSTVQLFQFSWYEAGLCKIHLTEKCSLTPLHTWTTTYVEGWMVLQGAVNKHHSTTLNGDGSDFSPSPWNPSTSKMLAIVLFGQLFRVVEERRIISFPFNSLYLLNKKSAWSAVRDGARPLNHVQGRIGENQSKPQNDKFSAGFVHTWTHQVVKQLFMPHKNGGRKNQETEKQDSTLS